MRDYINTFYITPEEMPRVVRLVERYPETYFKVRSWSRPDIWHLVRRAPDGFSCDCEDYYYRHRRGGMCDHIRKVRHLKTKYHSQRKKRLVAIVRAKRQLERVTRKFAKEARRLGFYQARTAKAKNAERAKFYAGNIKPIINNLMLLEKQGKRLVKAYPELAK